MEQISPHVYISSDHGACTVGAVRTSEGVVLVDAPNRATGAVRWREEVKSLGEVRYLINTEHHVDHVFGNHFLPGVIIANHYTKENFYQEGFHGKGSAAGPSRLLDPVGYTKDEDPEGIGLVADYRPREPEIVFRGGLTIGLGDVEIEVFEAAYAQRIPVLLKGPTGTGKTRFVEHMAWRLSKNSPTNSNRAKKKSV